VGAIHGHTGAFRVLVDASHGLNGVERKASPAFVVADGAFLERGTANRASVGGGGRATTATLVPTAANREEPMPRPAQRDSYHLMYAAQRALGLTQGETAALVGASKRTAQRWSSRRSPIYADYLAKLAAHVHAHDAALAAELAAAAGQTLESLGIVRPQPPAPPPLPPMPRHLAADAVVCVAAEGMNVSPLAVRGALLAAFKRARELGLSCEEMERALAGAGAAPAEGKKGKAGG
jgi:hypothetical protein